MGTILVKGFAQDCPHGEISHLLLVLIVNELFLENFQEQLKIDDENPMQLMKNQQVSSVFCSDLGCSKLA